LHECLQELNSRISKDAEKSAKARASAIDRLAFKAMKKRRAKKLACESTTDGNDTQKNIEDAQTALRQQTEQLDSLNSIVSEATDRLGESHRIQWTVGNWKLREIGNEDQRLLYAPTTIQDSVGRRWRAYAKKTPGEGRRDYGIGVFLECTTVSRLPALVSLRASLLHAHTHAPLGIPMGNKPRQVVFSKEERACGCARLVEGGEGRLSGLGAYDPTDDRLKFRVDFAVRDVAIPEEEGDEKTKTEKQVSSSAFM